MSQTLSRRTCGTLQSLLLCSDGQILNVFYKNYQNNYKTNKRIIAYYKTYFTVEVIKRKTDNRHLKRTDWFSYTSFSAKITDIEKLTAALSNLNKFQ